MDVFSTGNLGGLIIAATVVSALLFAAIVAGSALSLTNLSDTTMNLTRIGLIICIVAGFAGLIAVTGILISVLYKWKPVGDLLFDLYRDEGIAYAVPVKPPPIIIEQPTPKDVRRNVNVNVDGIGKLREKLKKKV